MTSINPSITNELSRSHAQMFFKTENLAPLSGVRREGLRFYPYKLVRPKFIQLPTTNVDFKLRERGTVQFLGH